MTIEQIKAKELAKLLNAFADGKQLQYKTDQFVWYDSNHIDYLIDSFISGREVRIKPETKRVPLTQQDLIDRELSNKTMRVDCEYCNRLIVDFDINGVVFLDESVSYKELMSSNFLDNSPCYKEVECE